MSSNPNLSAEYPVVRRPISVYLLTILVVVAAGVVRWIADPMLGNGNFFFTFLAAVVFGAWMGGWRPAALATILGLIVAWFFFLPPRMTFAGLSTTHQIGILIYLMISALFTAFGEAMRNAKEQSRVQAELLRITLKSIGDAVIATDAKGRVTFLNEVAEELTGWLAGRAKGKQLEEIFHVVNESTRKRIDNPANQALEGGTIVGHSNHTILISKNGTERPIDDSAAPILNRDNEIVGCVLVFRDITKRKQMENDLRQLAANLSEADRRKDEFLATLAHELRNPLAPIRTGLQVLKMGKNNDHAVEQTRSMMERQMTQVVRLVDDLIDLSRINSGKLVLRKERVELSAVVNSAIETSRPIIEQMSHRLSVELPKEPVLMNADMTRLSQVFMNLLNNAAKYSENGGEIHLTAEVCGKKVIVNVKDTGIGIPPDKLTSIFEMFSQVERSLEKAQGGLGIGLALAKRFVEMHDGVIEAKSSGLGKGAEFIVTLPIIGEKSSPLMNGEVGHSPPATTFRILIVDDNRDGADSLSMMLQMSGNDTRTAYDGQEAIEVADKFRPDLILLDIGLPKLNGYEVCQRIRTESWGKKTLIIALTGWGQEEDRRRSQEAGFNQHLVKPIDPNALMKILFESSK